MDSTERERKREILESQIEVLNLVADAIFCGKSPDVGGMLDYRRSQLAALDREDTPEQVVEVLYFAERHAKDGCHIRGGHSSAWPTYRPDGVGRYYAYHVERKNKNAFGAVVVSACAWQAIVPKGRLVTDDETRNLWLAVREFLNASTDPELYPREEDS